MSNDINSLMEYIEQGEKRINSARVKLMELTDDFDIWLKYATKKNYPFLLSRDNPIMKLVDEHIEYLYEYRHRVITVDYILEAMQELEDVGKISQEEILIIKKKMVSINFGSFKVDW